MTEAVEEGLVPSPSDARRTAERLAEESKDAIRSAMVDAEPESASTSTDAVRTAVRDRLDDGE